MASAYSGVRQRRLPRQPAADQPHHRHARATSLDEAQPPTARRVGAHDRRAQRLRHGPACCRRSRARAPRRRRRRRSSAPTSTARPAPPTIRIDAWFAGCQQTLVAVVWMGYDTPRKLGDRETGGGLALPVWIDYMETVLKGVPVQEPTRARRRRQPRRRVVLRGVRARRRRQQPRPRGQGRRRRRAERGGAQRASSTCSGADAAPTRLSALEARAAWPACALAQRRQHVEELAAARVSSQRPPTAAEVEAARAAPPATAPAAAAGC